MMPRVRLDGAARQLVSDLMFARMKAIRENNPYRVIFLSAESYQVLSDREDGAGVPVLTRDLSRDYRGVQLVANNNPVFNAGGTASVLATIWVRNEAGEHRLSVNITGRVKMQ
jgi:type IV fimbrial biogenesis protein FimT